MMAPVLPAPRPVRSARDQLYGLTQLGRRAARHHLLVATILVCGAAASVAVAMLRKHVYQSETVLMYREVIHSSYLGGPEGRASSQEIGMRLSELLLSRPRLERIIQEFKLYDRTVRLHGYVEAVDEMRREIDFKVGGGDTYRVSYRGQSPALVQAVTARLAESLINEDSKLRREQASTTREFLASQGSNTEQDLKDKERRLAEFLAQHPEFAQETASGAGGGAAGASIRAAKRAGRTDPAMLALERQANRIRRQLGVPTTAPVAAEDPRLKAAREAADDALGEAQRELQQKLAQFTERHPDVRAAKARVKEAEAQLARVKEAQRASSDAASGIPAGTRVDRAALERALHDVDQQIAGRMSARAAAGGDGAGGEREGASWIVALETDWTRLNREVAEARERNLALDTQKFKASLAVNSELSGNAARMMVVDPAYEPTRPAGLGRTMIVGAGLAISLVLAALVAFGLALVDDRLYDRLDLERLGLAPLLVVVPRAAGAGRRG